MNPNLTIYLMVESIERGQRDAKAARRRLAAEAATRRLPRRPFPTASRRALTALLHAAALLRGRATTTGVPCPLAPEKAC